MIMAAFNGNQAPLIHHGKKTEHSVIKPQAMYTAHNASVDMCICKSIHIYIYIDIDTKVDIKFFEQGVARKR